MATDKHYYIERRPDGRYSVRPKGSSRRSADFKTQEEAIKHAKRLNPHDHPDVERCVSMKMRHRAWEFKEQPGRAWGG